MCKRLAPGCRLPATFQKNESQALLKMARHRIPLAVIFGVFPRHRVNDDATQPNRFPRWKCYAGQTSEVPTWSGGK